MSAKQTPDILRSAVSSENSIKFTSEQLRALKKQKIETIPQELQVFIERDFKKLMDRVNATDSKDLKWYLKAISDKNTWNSDVAVVQLYLKSKWYYDWNIEWLIGNKTLGWIDKLELYNAANSAQPKAALNVAENWGNSIPPQERAAVLAEREALRNKKEEEIKKETIPFKRSLDRLENEIVSYVSTKEESFWDSIWLASEKSEEEKSKEILSVISADKIFEFLADYNNDGKIDKDDKNQLSGVMLMRIFKNKNISESNLVKNICELINLDNSWEKVVAENKQQLFDLLKSNPSYKNTFLSNLFRFSGAERANAEHVLKDWLSAAIQKSEKVRQHMENDSVSNALAKSLEQDFEKNAKERTKKSIEDYISRLESMKSDPAKYWLEAKDVEWLSKYLDYIKTPEVQKSFFDKIKMSSLSLAFSIAMSHIVWNKQWVAVGTSFSHEDINKTVQEYTWGFFESLHLDVWAWVFGGKLLPGIGLHFEKNWEFDEGKGRAFARPWVFLRIPYITAWGDYLVNENSLRQGFDDLTSSKRLWASFTLSTVAVGWQIDFKRNMLEWVERKTKAFSGFMDNVLPKSNWVESDEVYNWLLKSNIDKIRQEKSYMIWNEKVELSDKDIQWLDQVYTNISNYINTVYASWVNSLTKDTMISSIKSGYVENFQSMSILEAERDWTYISGFSIWIYLVFGFIPVPTIGWSLSKVNSRLEENRLSKLEEWMIAYTWAYSEAEKKWAKLSEIRNDFERIWVDVSYDKETGFMKISPISKANLDIYYNPSIKNNIWVDWDSLIIWDIGTLSYISQLSMNNQKIVMVIWWKSIKDSEKLIVWEDADVAVLSTLSKTPEKWMKSFDSVRVSKSVDGLYDSTVALNDRELADYISNNIKKFSNLPGKNFKAYNAFQAWMFNGQYDKATDSLISLISADPSLKSDKVIWSILSKMKSLKEKWYTYAMVDWKKMWVEWDESSLNSLAYILAQFQYGMYHIAANDKWDIKSQMKAREWWFSRSIQSTNSVYEKSDKYYQHTLDVDTLLWYQRQLSSSLKQWESFAYDPQMIWFIASYKKWADSSIHSMPAWTISVYGGKTLEVTDDKTKEWIVHSIVANKQHTINFARSLESHIKKYYPDYRMLDYGKDMTSLLLKWELDIDNNWKKVILDREFLFFLNWICKNESLGMKVKWLSIPSPVNTDEDIIIPIDSFNKDGRVQSAQVVWEDKVLVWATAAMTKLWESLFKKKEDWGTPWWWDWNNPWSSNSWVGNTNNPWNNWSNTP